MSIEESESAQEWFSNHGVDISLDEVKKLGELFAKIANGEITEKQLRDAAGSDGELSENELSEVAGIAQTGRSLFVDCAAFDYCGFYKRIHCVNVV